MSIASHQVAQRMFCVDTYIDRGLTLVRGEGVYLYDEDGVEYLDLMSNYGVNILGYSHPVITQALTDQLHSLTTLHGSFNNDVRATAAKILVKRCRGNLQQVFFSNSGSEAIEAALKFVVLSTHKKKFIVAKHGYHGKTLGALSATHSPKYKEALTPLLWDFEAVEFGNAGVLEEVLSQDVAGVILEPIQGEGGIYLPPDDYLKEIREICTRHEVLLILDEIQTGCGRTGRFLASHTADIAYDIVCLGKGLAGGIPVGATLVTEFVAKSIPKHIHTSTFGGNPLACAGIVATLGLINDELLKNVRELGLYFQKQLSQLDDPSIVAIRGAGLMIGIEVGSSRDWILKELQKQRILAIPAGESVIRLLPPFIINKQHVNHFVKVLKQCVDLL